MELSKRNETVWVVKRTDKPGRFLLKSVEEAGEYTEFSIGMELEKSKIMFDMDMDEFENFYKIMTNFKNLIEGSPAGFSQMASSSSGWSKTPTKAPPGTPVHTDIPQLSLDGNAPPTELIDTGYSHLDDIDNNDSSLASLEELDQIEELTSVFVQEDLNNQSSQSLSPPITQSSNQSSDELKSFSPTSTPVTKEDDSEELMAKISEMASKLHNIPPPKPIASYISSKSMPAKMPLEAPVVLNEDLLKSQSIEKVESSPSEAGKKKGNELKESDWDPW